MKKLNLLILVLVLACITGFAHHNDRRFYFKGGGFFSGDLYQRNTDTTFSEITTGDSHEISEITAADPAVVTFAGGDELVTDPTFDTACGVNWACSAGWTISGGTATHSGAAGDLYQPSIGAVSGAWYKIVFTISGRTAGGMTVKFGNDTVVGFIANDNTYTYYHECVDVGLDRFNFYANADFDGSIDNASVKLLHDYAAKDVISIGGVESEALGADLGDDCASDNTGDWQQVDCTLTFDTDHYEIDYVANTQWIRKTISYTSGSWYKLQYSVKDGTASGESIRFSDINTGLNPNITYSATTTASWVTHTQYFQADGSSNRAAFFTELTAGNIEIKAISLEEIPPVLAKPYRIDSIDANGVCTLLNADFSGLTTNITSGYTTSASLTNWTEGDGWMAGVDMDPTPVNSNSEFDQWSYSAELIIASDNRDFTTWGNVDWAGEAGASVADGTGKMQITLDSSGESGARLSTGIIGVDEAGTCVSLTLEIWQGTTSETTFRIRYGNGSNPYYEDITIDGVANTSYAVTLVSNFANPGIYITCLSSDSGTLFVDNVSVTEITPDSFTVSGLSATNYLVYDTSANTVRFVSDGSNLYLRTDSTIADDSQYFYEVGISANAAVRLILYSGGAIEIMDGLETGHFQGFLTTESTTLDLRRSGSCNVTASYFRLYKAEDTYAVCDGSQSAVSTLLSNEFWVLNNFGYKFVTTVGAIDAGSLTPIAGTGYGSAITGTGVNTQNVRGRTTYEYAGLEASTAAEGVKVTELVIYRYKDLWGQWNVWGDQ